MLEVNGIAESGDEDADMREIARQEAEELATRQAECERELIRTMAPRDPLDDGSCIVEVRAGMSPSPIAAASA